MTTELTKAAQQAHTPEHIAGVDHAHELLRRMGYHRDGDWFIHANRRGAEAIHISTISTIVNAGQMALTQRPAAQTEREAFEAWWPTVGQTIGKVAAWEAWHARAMHAPQQATPEPLEQGLREIWQECRKLKGTTDGRKHVEAHALADWIMAKVSRLRATPEPSRGMIGMGSHALANELAQAVAQDDADPDGHDMSAGLFGPNVSDWLRKVATEYLSKPATTPQQAAGEPVGEPAGYTFVQPVPEQCDRIIWRGQYIHLPITRPAPGVPEGFALEGWMGGVESAAKLIEEKASNYAAEFGHDDDGLVSFGTGRHAEIKLDHYNSLIELADEVRALTAAQAKGGE